MSYYCNHLDLLPEISDIFSSYGVMNGGQKGSGFFFFSARKNMTPEHRTVWFLKMEAIPERWWLCSCCQRWMFGTLRILFPSCIHNISWPVSQSCQGVHLVQPINEINYSDKKTIKSFKIKSERDFFFPSRWYDARSSWKPEQSECFPCYNT